MDIKALKCLNIYKHLFQKRLCQCNDAIGKIRGIRRIIPHKARKKMKTLLKGGIYSLKEVVRETDCLGKFRLQNCKLLATLNIKI